MLGWKMRLLEPGGLGLALEPRGESFPHCWALRIASSPKREALSFFEWHLLSAYCVYHRRHGAETRSLFLWSVHFGWGRLMVIEVNAEEKAHQ